MGFGIDLGGIGDLVGGLDLGHGGRFGQAPADLLTAVIFFQEHVDLDGFPLPKTLKAEISGYAANRPLFQDDSPVTEEGLYAILNLTGLRIRKVGGQATWKVMNTSGIYYNLLDDGYLYANDGENRWKCPKTLGEARDLLFANVDIHGNAKRPAKPESPASPTFEHVLKEHVWIDDLTHMRNEGWTLVDHAVLERPSSGVSEGYLYDHALFERIVKRD